MMFLTQLSARFTRDVSSCHIRSVAFSAAAKVNPASNVMTKKTPPKGKESKSFGLNKEERKHFRKRLKEASQETSKNHIFKQLYPWKTKKDLAKYIKESEVYHEDGLIALCKPYGIAQVKAESKAEKGTQTIIQTLNGGGVAENTPALENILPILQEMYNVEHLELVKTTERWTSGLLLLSTDPKVTSKVQKCFRFSKSLEQPPFTYWAVTNGLPNLIAGATKVAISLEDVSNIGKVPVIKKNYTRAEIKRGNSKMAVIEHSTLNHNESLGVSLVEVNIQMLKWHCLRVWLAYSYSAVLGDALYGGRVKSVAGKKILVSPHNLGSYQPQEISSDIYKKLQLSEKASELIPSLIHLAKIKLVKFNKDKSDLVLTAPPPEHFMWTCIQLGLMSPDSSEDEDCERSMKSSSAGTSLQLPYGPDA